MRRIAIALLVLAAGALILLAVLADAGKLVTHPSPSPVQAAALTPSPAATPVTTAAAVSAPASAASPPPTATPEPTPEPTAAERLLSEMTLREKLCQMIAVRPASLIGVYPLQDADERLQGALQDFPAGGFFLDSSNMASGKKLQELTACLRDWSKITPLIFCDEEGGSVSRLMQNVGTTKIGAMYSYRNEGTEKAFANAEIIGRDLLAYGLNADLAPVADVWSNPENTVIRTRAYSDDFFQAAELVAAAVKGFHASGVICTLKHFPGHGDTLADSHNGKVYINKSLQELREGELLPFKAGIEAGADMVMTGHLIITAIDEEPAPFSRAVVTELLREELGFRGVVITDSMEMDALGSYTVGDAVLRAVRAGVDLLLCPGDPEEALLAMESAVESGELPEERIDESVLRILSMKEKYGLLAD